ncbi:hypothetical protein ACXJJ3_15035 [Kribbella sp. WER1]
MRAWALELDRTFAELGEIAADARTFDRLRMNRLADSWDNTIYSFVGAACTRRPWVRSAISGDGTAYRDWRSQPSESVVERGAFDCSRAEAEHVGLVRLER